MVLLPLLGGTATASFLLGRKSKRSVKKNPVAETLDSARNLAITAGMLILFAKIANAYLKKK